MESVEWIFSDHKLHMAMLQLLREEQNFLCDSVWDTDSDEEISGIVLASPTLDGMPHKHGAGSSTEWAVMKLEEVSQNRQTLAAEIQRYGRILRLHDAVMQTLTDDERWFVEHHYDNGQSLSILPTLSGSPFSDLSRSTMSNYRKRLLQKASSFLAHLQSING